MTTLVLNKTDQHDRVSDSARISRAGRDRAVGRILVSAEIIRFIARPKHSREFNRLSYDCISISGTA